MQLKTDDIKTEKLKSDKQRLQYILQCSKTGTWEWNMLTGKTVFNPRWAEIIGYRLAEIKPSSVDTWRRFVHPEDLPGADRCLSMHISGQADHYECDIRMKHKEGHWVWVKTTGQIYKWTKEGEAHMMAGTHVEITGPKENCLALKKSEKRLLLALRVTKASVFEHDLSFGSLFTTPELYRDLGYGGDERPMSPEAAAELIHPEDLPELDKALERYLMGETDHYFSEYRIRTKEGQWKWCSAIGEAVDWGEDGKPRKLLGITQNIDGVSYRRREPEPLRQEQPEQDNEPSG